MDIIFKIRTMNTLELFAGSCSFSKVAKELGHKTFTTDIEQFGDIDLVCDLLDLSPGEIPYIPDVIWASPPCTGFSVASIGHHWTGGKNAYIPKTETARLGIALVKGTLKMIKYFENLNPNLLYYIENPRGVLRKLGLLDEVPYHHTITYCKYGSKNMKPTDVWCNDKNWTPRLMCKNGDKCHISAPRGSRTGTQGLKGAYERSKIPPALFEEIFKIKTKKIKTKTIILI